MWINVSQKFQAGFRIFHSQQHQQRAGESRENLEEIQGQNRSDASLGILSFTILDVPKHFVPHLTCFWNVCQLSNMTNLILSLIQLSHFRLLPPTSPNGGAGASQAGGQQRPLHLRQRPDNLSQQRPPGSSNWPDGDQGGQHQATAVAHEPGKQSCRQWPVGDPTGNIQAWPCHKRNTMDWQARQQQQQQQQQHQQQ